MEHILTGRYTCYFHLLNLFSNHPNVQGTTLADTEVQTAGSEDTLLNTHPPNKITIRCDCQEARALLLSLFK